MCVWTPTYGRQKLRWRDVTCSKRTPSHEGDRSKEGRNTILENVVKENSMYRPQNNMKNAVEEEDK